MFITGQKVVCVDDKAPSAIINLYTHWIKEGQVYVVRNTSIGTSYTLSGGKSEGEIIVYLVGVVNPRGGKNGEGQERGFNAMRFRSLNEKSSVTAQEQDKEDLIGITLTN